jgi:oligoendopeptidase F
MIETFSTSSKIWIFMGNEKFNSTQQKIISNELASFLASWQSHGKDLTASFEIKHNQFIAIAADESIEKPSGCSIDSLIHIIKKIEKITDLTLLNRSLVGFMQNKNDEEISVLSLNDFRQKLKENSFEKDILVFNPSVSTIEEYTNNWIQPVIESWAQSFSTSPA